MTYHYSDPSRETEPNALPDVEVFEATHTECPERRAGHRFFYVFGSPGYLWNSNPVGPFETEAQALAAARGES